MSTQAAPAFRETYPADLQSQIIRLSAEIGCAGPVLLVMPFAGRLDAARIARAARLVVDAEPMLGCRFEIDARRALWRRRTDLDAAQWCVVHTVADTDALIRQLLTPIPEHIDRTFLLHLVHRPDGDTLIMWINHMLADAYAAGLVAGLLGEIYTRLGGEPDYRPEPNPADAHQDAWATNISFLDTLRIVRRDVVDAIQCRGLVHSFERDYRTFVATPKNDAAFAIHRIPPELVNAIDRAAGQRRSTRNELLTTAFLRAFAEFGHRGHKAKAQVGLTINLRRFAPAGPALRTSSMVGMTRVSLRLGFGATFDETLAEVKAILDRQKKALMGAANPIFVRLLGLMSRRRMRAMILKLVRKTIDNPMSPTFSNAGHIEAESLSFDGATPTDLAIVVYPAGLPLFLVSALEYRGAVSLTCCFQPADLSIERVHRFLERVVRECPADAAPQPVERAREPARAL